MLKKYTYSMLIIALFAMASLNASQVQGKVLAEELKLFYFAKYGAVAKLKIQLKKDINKNAQNEDGDTALMVTLRNEIADGGIFDALIEAQVSLDIPNKLGDTALMLAIRNYRNFYAKKLIALGANINVENLKGETALIGAAKIGDAPSFMELILHDANLYHKQHDGEDFFSIIDREGYSWLLQNLKVQEVLGNYEKRRIEYSKSVISPHILAAINIADFIQNLTDIVAEYVVEAAPVKTIEAEQKALAEKN